MQGSLLNQLCQTTTFSARLITILENVRKSVNSRWNKSTIKQIEHHLVSLTCQNKNLLHYKYLEEKNNNQRCLAYIIEILTITAKFSKQSRQNIACLFLSHVLSHTSCYVSYYTFYILLETVPEIITEIPHDTLTQINSKLKKQQNSDNFKILQSIRIDQSEAFTSENIQLCQRNLDNYLWDQIQPSVPVRQKQKNQKNLQMKIPPLIIPTSKSINSSRYSELSRQQKRKGLADLQKLANNLGQGFITVELGCLLANKRTRQVQQFSQNQAFREKCLQKLDHIETQRLNSSRLTMNKAINDYQDLQQNAKKYYRKVLTINLNICQKKLPHNFNIVDWIHKKINSSKKKTESSAKQTQSTYLINYLHQIMDMSLVGMINLTIDQKQKSSKKQNLYHDATADIFSKLIRNLKSISQIARSLMSKVSIESEKLHLNMLINRNKGESTSHFSFDIEQSEVNDKFLGELSIKVNQPARVQGLWKDHKRILTIKKYSEPILLYLGSWMQSLQQLADMSHPMFYFYQTNILKTISFYMNACTSKISSYYFAEYIFKLFLMVKREILQLTHPYIGPRDPFKNTSLRIPLSHRYPELLQHFIMTLTALLEGSSKHLEKLISNIFLKNVYFMEIVQNYFQFIVNKQDVQSVIHILRFYKKSLQIYTNLIKKPHNSNKHTQNSATYFLFQHIAEYICPRNGCLALTITKYESFISPSTLDECDNEEAGSASHKSNNQASSGLLAGVKNSQYSIQQYLHEIFLFVAHIYYLACPSNHDSLLILEQDVCSFYIKYSIMHFIRLYSLLTVHELANISGTSRRNNQLDYMLSTKQSPHTPPKINTKQIFMIDFLKILTNISINRTPQIAKKFRQYRVLEFFVRQIQLQFCVKQNIEKYIKKASNIRSVSQVLAKNQQKQAKQKKKQKQVQKEYSNVGNLKGQVQLKKTSVPGLNLTGQLFKKSSDEPKQKQLNNTIAQKAKKIVPALNIPIKTQESYDSKESKQRSKKGFLDDMLEEIVTKNPKKKSFKEELNLKLDGLNLGSKERSSIGKGKSPKQSSDSNMIYFTERKIRKIYSNKILHAQSILLILSLILYKGQLDPIYCDQMPIIHGKLNVLYILHYHLNHQKNKSIVSVISQYVSKIKPILSGQRLFKLLSNQYTDLSQYYEWAKINAGAFGVIMSAKTHLIEPKEVAIKQMNFPKSIYERCVLNDIFTEITSLEMFRLQDRVTKMYNYGVIDNTYVIIMKKYTCSLRDWRLANIESPQAKLFPPTLPNILLLFYEVIKGLKLLHQQNVTHYDIKGDNILLQFLPSADPRQPPKVNIVFADFGVAKIYEDEKDELDLKSRGTECIKSPEMLTLTLKNKKQADNYDRRKKIGTTKASDIWSLGCLLYQIVTGQYLFNSNDWVHFFMLVTSQNQQILSPQNCEKMKNNIYLIDFIKYILIRDPQHRPSIQSIICRFESLYSLLVSNPERTASSNLRVIQNKCLEQMVDDYIKFIKKQSRNEGQNYMIEGTKRLKSEGEFGRTGKVMQFFNPKFTGKITKIMEDMYFCQRESQVIEYQQIIRHEGITHIIVQSKSVIDKNKFKVIEIESSSNHFTIGLVYRASPRVSDVLRQVLLLKGKLLFVNSESNFCINLLIFTLSYWFKCTAFETWCLINTQILSFPALASSIGSMSHAVSKLSKIDDEVQEMPKLQCICGSVTIILKKKFQEKRGEMKICKCKKNKSQNASCFSKNCPAYLQFIRKRYNIIWDHLTWTLVGNNQLLTPLFQSNCEQMIYTQVMLNSADPLSNMITDSKQADQWKLYECKTCEMWILATDGKEIWLILNNLIKSCRQGIMIPNAQQDYKAKVPALNYYTLSKLHMTSQ